MVANRATLVPRLEGDSSSDESLSITWCGKRSCDHRPEGHEFAAADADDELSQRAAALCRPGESSGSADRGREESCHGQIGSTPRQATPK